jgi:aryl-alcohol dehydrogenase-like predicted oxidoreductase
LVSEQSLYNLSDRMIELEVVPACREYGIGIIPWSPLAGGMLAGALQKSEEGRRSREWVQEKIEKQRSRLVEYEDFCEELGESPTTVALTWLLANKQVTAPIVGPRTMEQLEGSLRSLDFTLDDDSLAKLDEIWPGPGGEAPEAYSW